MPKKYAREILKKFRMEDCKSTATPMNQRGKFSKDDEADKVEEHQFKSLIGCLIFLTATRPDIMFAISMLLRFMHYASEVHLQVVKQIVRYVKGAVDYGVKYTHSQNFQFHGYSDSDQGGSIDDMKSTTGYCFSFGSCIFSWSSKKQDIVSKYEEEINLATAHEHKVANEYAQVYAEKEA